MDFTKDPKTLEELRVAIADGLISQYDAIEIAWRIGLRETRIVKANQSMVTQN
jgi:hypothetical protein